MNGDNFLVPISLNKNPFFLYRLTTRPNGPFNSETELTGYLTATFGSGNDRSAKELPLHSPEYTKILSYLRKNRKQKQGILYKVLPSLRKSPDCPVICSCHFSPLNTPQSSMGNNTPESAESIESIFLGVLLETAHVINGWEVRGKWDSITATGTFNFIGELNDELQLKAIENHNEKFEGFINEGKRGIIPLFLFLYISEDSSLEAKSTENIQVKCFSPSKNTVFDVLNYVFKLPVFPKTSYEEQQQYFTDFENAAKRKLNQKNVTQKNIVPMTEICRAALEVFDKNPDKSLFIHGLCGCRKSYLAYEIARNLVWNNKIDMPVWVDFKNDKAEEVYMNRGGASFANEIWNEFSKKKLIKDKTYLVIIDGLDIGEPVLADFLRAMNSRFANLTNGNIRIIYTSVIEYRTDFDSSLVGYSPPGFTNDELVYFIDMVLEQSPDAKCKIDSIRQGNEEDKKLYKVFVDFLNENCGSLPGMIEFIIAYLARPGITIGSFLNDMKKNPANVGIVTNRLVNIYNRAFDPLEDEAKYLLLYLLNFNVEYISRKKMQDSVDNLVTGQSDPGKTVTSILNCKDIFNKTVGNLVCARFIRLNYDGDEVCIKIKDTMTYKTLLSENVFSLNGLREKLISDKKMLKYHVMQFVSMGNNSDKNERKEQIEMFEFRLNRLGPQRLIDIKYEDEGGCNILHGIARFCTDEEIYEFLWENYRPLFYDTNGEKPVADKLGQTIFQYAAAHNELNILTWFHEKFGKKPEYLNSKSAEENHAIHFCAKFNKRPEVMRYFLEKDIFRLYINDDNKIFYTPLIYACWKNTPEIVEMLLAELTKKKYSIVNGLKNINPLSICFADVDEDEKEGEKKIEKKRKITDMKEIINSIKKYAGGDGFKSLVEGGDKDGNIPLHYALRYTFDGENTEKVEELLRELFMSDANLLNRPNESGFTPFHNAAGYQSHEIVSFLVEAGAEISRCSYKSAGPFGFIYPIHYAAMLSDDGENAKILCGGGRELLNIPDNFGSTPLHYAIQEGNAVMIDALVELGADINKRDTWGTPLELAARKGIPRSSIQR
ncbi:MAG: ankyrin repeat domain-containing protein [Treponema sp.]|jgi:ankyrin repeat protein|nr:ankyrin repeat domain-containing protein [Treponema sp.]